MSFEQVFELLSVPAGRDKSWSLLQASLLLSSSAEVEELLSSSAKMERVWSMF
jgi:hypothetical protein